MSEVSSRSQEPRQRLGRGLAALLGNPKVDTPDHDASQSVKIVPIEFIRTNARNPRQYFDDADLNELAASIRERGIIQPIIVRPIKDISDAFEIVAGERRWRAAQLAGQHTVPVIALQLTNKEALELSIVENVQRSDLNALEEARGYAQLAAEHGYNHADIGRVIGKSRSHVANTLRLLGLPERAKELLKSGALTAGHARALLGVTDPNAVADEIVARSLTVRDVEKLNAAEKSSASESKQEIKVDPTTDELLRRLSLSLGATVNLRQTERFKEIRIRVSDFEQLEFICSKLLRD